MLPQTITKSYSLVSYRAQNVLLNRNDPFAFACEVVLVCVFAVSVFSAQESRCVFRRSDALVSAPSTAHWANWSGSVPEPVMRRPYPPPPFSWQGFARLKHPLPVPLHSGGFFPSRHRWLLLLSIDAVVREDTKCCVSALFRVSHTLNHKSVSVG